MCVLYDRLYSIIILKVFENEVVVRVIDFTAVIKQVGHCMHMTSDLNSFRDVTTYAKEKKCIIEIIKTRYSNIKYTQ